MADRTAELQDKMISNGIPVLSIRRTGSNVQVIYAPDATAEQIAAGDALVASQDWSDDGDRAWMVASIRKMASDLAVSTDNPMAIIARSGNRVTYQSVVPLYIKINQIIDYLQAPLGRPVPSKLPAPRAWKEVLDAGRAVARSEIDPES